MSVAFGVQSRRQFVRCGRGAAALAGVVVDEEPADAAAVGSLGACPFGEAVARSTVLLFDC